MFMVVEQLDREIRDEDRVYLARMAADPRVEPFHPVTALVGGEPAHALEKYARSCGIDLIVMTTHGRGGLSRAWYGSVADALIRRVDIPVLLLRPPGSAPPPVEPLPAIRRVLLTVDGSEHSESLIHTAIALGGFANTFYTLLQVMLPLPPIGYTDTVTAPLDAKVADEAAQHAAEHLDGLANELRAKGYSVNTAMIVHGDVAHAIRDYAVQNEIDLIAMVTHGRGGWKRLVLGSVADRVIRETAIPLLVLHPQLNAAPAGR